MKKYLVSMFVLFTIMLPSVALAQDGGGAADPSGLFVLLFDKIQGGEWLPAFGAALMLIVWLVRTLISKKYAWFGTKLGGATLAFGISISMAIATALVAGQPITVGLVATAMGVAWAAGGGWENFKDVLNAVKK